MDVYHGGGLRRRLLVSSIVAERRRKFLQLGLLIILAILTFNLSRLIRPFTHRRLAHPFAFFLFSSADGAAVGKILVRIIECHFLLPFALFLNFRVWRQLKAPCCALDLVMVACLIHGLIKHGFRHVNLVQLEHLVPRHSVKLRLYRCLSGSNFQLCLLSTLMLLQVFFCLLSRGVGPHLTVNLANLQFLN